jgi:hypothetical protein
MSSEEEFCGTAAKEKLSYDARGRLRNPATQTAYTPGSGCLSFSEPAAVGSMRRCSLDLFGIKAKNVGFGAKSQKSMNTMS